MSARSVTRSSVFGVATVLFCVLATSIADATLSSSTSQSAEVRLRAFPRWRQFSRLKDTSPHASFAPVPHRIRSHDTSSYSAASLVEAHAQAAHTAAVHTDTKTRAVSHTQTSVKAKSEGEAEYDAYFTGANDKPEYLLTNNRDANPFRSLTPYGQINPHNVLATLIPPKDSLSVDSNPAFRFMGEENPNQEPVKPYDLERHAITVFLELKSAELRAQSQRQAHEQNHHAAKSAAPTAAAANAAALLSLDDQTPDAASLLQVDSQAPPRARSIYDGVGGNAFNAFYGAGGRGPAWVLPVEPIGAPFRSRTGVPLHNIKASDVAPVATPPLGVMSAEGRTPDDRYMPLFDRPSSANGVGPFSFLEIERHERIAELQNEFEHWYVNGGHHEVAQRAQQQQA